MIIYAGDILLQCKGMMNMQRALDAFTELWHDLGLVSNDEKLNTRLKIRNRII